MKTYIAITLFLIFGTTYTYSQSKFELNVGVGFWEAISLKAKYGDQLQIGLAQGFAGFDFYQSSIELYYHFNFNRKSDPNQTKLLSLYVMGGVGTTYLSKKFQNHITNFYPRLGLTINFSKKTGINLDFGPCASRIRNTDGNYYWSHSPSGSVHFFIRV